MLSFRSVGLVGSVTLYALFQLNLIFGQTDLCVTGRLVLLILG